MARTVVPAQLVLAAREGDESAFDDLVRLCGPVWIPLAARFYAPGMDRDDMRQEALLGLHKAVRDWDGCSSSFVTFLEMVVTRQLVTTLKTARRLKHGPLNDSVSLSAPVATSSGGESVELAATLPGRGEGPDEVFERRRRMGALAAYMRESLTPLERNAMVLCAVHRVAYGEVAARLRVDEKTVDNALQRARRKVSAFLRSQRAVTDAVPRRNGFPRPPMMLAPDRGVVPPSKEVVDMAETGQTERASEREASEALGGLVESSPWRERTLREAQERYAHLSERQETLRAEMLVVLDELPRARAIVAVMSAPTRATLELRDGAEVAEATITAEAVRSAAAEAEEQREAPRADAKAAKPKGAKPRKAKAKAKAKAATSATAPEVPGHLAAMPALQHGGGRVAQQLPAAEAQYAALEAVRDAAEPLVVGEVAARVCGRRDDKRVENNVSRHLRELERAGLVRRTGRNRRKAWQKVGRAGVEYERVEGAGESVADDGEASADAAGPELARVRDFMAARNGSGSFTPADVVEATGLGEGVVRSALRYWIAKGAVAYVGDEGGEAYEYVRPSGSGAPSEAKVDGRPRSGPVAGTGRPLAIRDEKLRQLVADIENAGGTVARVDSGHLRVSSPTGESRNIASTPGTGSSVKDSRARIRRDLGLAV